MSSRPCPTRLSSAERLLLTMAFAPGATVEFYGAPIIDRRDTLGVSLLSIRAVSGPAGIYFNYLLSADRSYRLTITGKVVSGSMESDPQLRELIMTRSKKPATSTAKGVRRLHSAARPAFAGRKNLN